MTLYAFKPLTRSAAALLILFTGIGSSTSQAYPSRDFDAVPSASDRAADVQPTDAKAWCDRDFDFSIESEVTPREKVASRDFDAVPSTSDRTADAQSTDAKAWYDRDFDFSVESEMTPREEFASRDFVAVGTGSGRRGQAVQGGW